MQPKSNTAAQNQGTREILEAKSRIATEKRSAGEISAAKAPVSY